MLTAESRGYPAEQEGIRDLVAYKYRYVLRWLSFSGWLAASNPARAAPVLLPGQSLQTDRSV